MTMGCRAQGCRKRVMEAEGVGLMREVEVGSDLCRGQGEGIG
jgi:hypothetical protein